MPRKKQNKNTNVEVGNSESHEGAVTSNHSPIGTTKTSEVNSNDKVSSSKSDNVISNSRPAAKTGDKSRVIYVASACHVCKAVNDPESGIRLSACAGCRMVKYCSKGHQVDDWPSHKQICNAIRKILKAEGRKHLYEGCSNFVENQSQWLQMRFHYMQTFRDLIERELEPYEKEMMLFPVCFCTICSPQGNMTLCDICHHHHHQSDLSTKGESQWCEEFRMWLDLITWESNIGLMKPYINNKLKFSPGVEFPKDIQTYLSRFPSPEGFPENLSRAVTAEVATVPLSILWSILENAKSLAQGPTLTIHLIGAEMDFEGNHPIKWEMFLLHHLPAVRKLNLVLIGPELLPDSTIPLLCTDCKHKGNQLKISYESGTLYHEYRQDESFVRPHIICAFNCGMYRKTGFNGEDTWSPTIPLLANTDMLITTAYTETEVSQDSERLLSQCPGLRMIEHFRENPFRSLRPQRTLINEDVEPLMYKNQYIATFKGI
ncbi:unnamed protein product [Allacma fusca]|uniref:MYND-type domain-containing protein n=1 Tax=Allacma fusca TaxID=39272 RepID=A0A8J2K2T8_9HEXA|nr:unnamed protein product [Allacma fusca]